MARLLENPRHAGSAVDGAATAAAGSVRRGCAVQFSAVIGGQQLSNLRYLAFGGPRLIAACEHVARAAEGASIERAVQIASAQGWLAELGLPRDALADLLVAEDAWRGLLDALADGRRGN